MLAWGADLSVTPKTITVAANAQSKVYGDVNPSLTYTATGLVNNDTLSGELSTFRRPVLWCRDLRHQPGVRLRTLTTRSATRAPICRSRRRRSRWRRMLRARSTATSIPPRPILATGLVNNDTPEWRTLDLCRPVLRVSAPTPSIGVRLRTPITRSVTQAPIYRSHRRPSRWWLMRRARSTAISIRR